MLSIRKITTTAAALSAALALGTAGSAWAQTTPTEPAPATHKDSGGATKSESKKEMDQESLDRKKVTLKDKAQEQIDAANANIDQLRKLSSNATGPTKTQHEDMSKQLSDARDKLKKDMNKVDTATLADWNTVRPQVKQDLTALHAKLKHASSVTNVPVPEAGMTDEPGATNKQKEDKQPGATNKQQEEKKEDKKEDKQREEKQPKQQQTP
ncbi:MAG: hypothetical protein FWD17_14410 [Polyangiaceae bacterium]|nr:hypothetical protein [Polyangiaceae bacterium]